MTSLFTAMFYVCIYITASCHSKLAEHAHACSVHTLVFFLLHSLHWFQVNLSIGDIRTEQIRIWTEWV